MEIKSSPLNLLDFFVLNLEFKSIPAPEDIDVDIYGNPIELDFGLKDVEDAKGMRAFYIKIWSNVDKEQNPGYAYFVESVSYFEIIDEKNLDKKIVNNLLSNSIVGLAYTNLRAVLAQTSAFAPYGKYILPTIDLLDIFKKKQAKIEKE